jgi:hypothetical protein
MAATDTGLSEKQRFAALVYCLWLSISIGVVAYPLSATWQKICGGLACVAADSYRRKQQLGVRQSIKASWQTMRLISGAFEEDIAPAKKFLGQQKVEIQSRAFEQLPFGEYLAERKRQEFALKVNGLGTICERWLAVILGDQGDGKTTLANWFAAQFMATHPEGTLLIADLHYGACHKGDKPNTWMGLPLDQVVLTEAEQCYDALFALENEVQERYAAFKDAARAGKTVSFPPFLLLFDEWAEFYGGLTKDQLKHVDRILKLLATGAVKVGVGCLFFAHYCSVDGVGIKQSQWGAWDIMALYNWTQVNTGSTTSNLPPGYDEKREELLGFKRQVGGFFTCMTYTKSARWQVAGIPEIDRDNLKAVPMDDRRVAEMLNRLDGYTGKLTKSAIWQELGFPAKERSNSNPYYRNLDTVINHLKEASDV